MLLAIESMRYIKFLDMLNKKEKPRARKMLYIKE